MVDGLAPHIAYYPVAALAALTAALVTLLVAVGAWRRSPRKDSSDEGDPQANQDGDGVHIDPKVNSEPSDHAMTLEAYSSSKEECPAVTEENSVVEKDVADFTAWEPVEKTARDHEYEEREEDVTGDYEGDILNREERCVDAYKSGSTIYPQLYTFNLPSPVELMSSANTSEGLASLKRGLSQSANDDSESGSLLPEKTGEFSEVFAAKLEGDVLKEAFIREHIPSGSDIINNSEESRFFSSPDACDLEQLQELNAKLSSDLVTTEESTTRGSCSTQSMALMNYSHITSEPSQCMPSQRRAQAVFKSLASDSQSSYEEMLPAPQIDASLEFGIVSRDENSYSFERDVSFGHSIVASPTVEQNNDFGAYECEETSSNVNDDEVDSQLINEPQLANESNFEDRRKTNEVEISQTHLNVLDVLADLKSESPAMLTISDESVNGLLEHVRTSTNNGSVNSLETSKTVSSPSYVGRVSDIDNTEVPPTFMPKLQLLKESAAFGERYRDFEFSSLTSEKDVQINQGSGVPQDVIFHKTDRKSLQPITSSYLDVGTLGTECSGNNTIPKPDTISDLSSRNCTDRQQLKFKLVDNKFGSPIEMSNSNITAGASEENVRVVSPTEPTKKPSSECKKMRRRRSIENVPSVQKILYQALLVRGDFSHSLDSVFFQYDVRDDEMNRSKLVVEDPDLFAKVKFAVSNDWATRVDSSSTVTKFSLTREEELEQVGEKQTEEQGINIENSVHVKSDSVESNVEVALKNGDVKHDASSVSRGENFPTATTKLDDLDSKCDDEVLLPNQTGKNAVNDQNGVVFSLVSVTETDMPREETYQSAFNKTECSSTCHNEETRHKSKQPVAEMYQREKSHSEESKKSRISIFSDKVGKSEVFRERSKGNAHAEDNSPHVLREDNCVGEHYSWLPSADVTSEGIGAVHYGTARAVQGSWRGALIGKACSEFYNAAETRSRGVSESPAYDESEMQMANDETGSCGYHDLEPDETRVKADRLGLLDELADELRELAGCTGNEDISRHSQSAEQSLDRELNYITVTPKDWIYQHNPQTGDASANSDFRWRANERIASSCEENVNYNRGNIVEEWEERTNDFGGTSVGLLSDFYKENSGALPTRECRRRLEDCYFSSEFSASESSNYTSDSSQSLCLSSFNGDTGSSFSSCPDSPPSGKENALLSGYIRFNPDFQSSLTSDESEADQPKGVRRVTDIDGSGNSSRAVGFSEQPKGNQFHSKLNVEPLVSNEPFGNAKLKSYSLIKSCKVTAENAEESDALSSESSPGSLPALETVVQKSSENINNLFEKKILSAMDDSTRNIRLQKLFERDRERRDRLRQISERNNTNLENNSHLNIESEGHKNTLQAIETAISHMQQIIHKEKTDIPQSQTNESDLQIGAFQPHTNSKQKTLNKGDDTEIRRYNLISFDSAPYKHYTNEETPQNSRLNNVCKISSSTDEKYPELKERKGKNYGEGKSEKEDWEDVMQNVMDKFSIYKGANETGSHQRKSANFENELVSAESTDRWRLRNEEAAKTEKISDNRKLNIIADELRIETKTTTQTSGKDKNKRNSLEETIELFSSIDQTTLLKIEPARNVDKKSGEKSKSEGEAECRWRRAAARDVVKSPDQSLSSCLRRERSAEAAATFRAPFSDDLRQTPVSEMESGGCEMENATSPPPAPTANAATNTTPTPTKIKNLRFKLDPDVYDLPSENGYYADDDDYKRSGWRKQPKYHTFSSLDLGRSREPVKVVSVKTSVVPAGTKMVVKPVCVSEGQLSTRGEESEDPRVTVKKLDIDLRIRLETNEREKNVPDTEKIFDVVRADFRASPDRQPKRSYLSSSPAQSKRRSPIPDFSGWNQSLSPVSENCDWVTVHSTSPGEIVLSTSSDPGEGGKVFSLHDSLHDSSNSDLNVTDDAVERAKISDSSADNDQRSELHGEVQSRKEEPLKQSPDVFTSKGTNAMSSSAAPLTSTPSRPSTLELNHFRKHFQIPRKKFVPDPEAIERITGFKAAEEKSTTKPPLPPVIRSLPSSHRMSSGAKSRIDQLRKRYLDTKSLMAAQRLDSSTKFEQFLNSAQEDRAKLANSTPDLAAFEAAVRSQWSKIRSDSRNGSSAKENNPPLETAGSGVPARSATPDDVWMNYVQLLRRQLNRRSQSMSYLETDIDAFFAEDKCRSMMTLERSPPNSTQSLVMPSTKTNRISTNLEETGRTKSEHELRIEKSLQNLTLPEWYKHSQRPKTGFILDKKSEEKRGWAAAKSLTSSTTSLTSSGNKPRRPARSLRTSQENLIWSRGSASPASADNSYSRYAKVTNGPVLSLAVAKAFREPYIGWRARTPSSCASPSPQVDNSPPSWVVMDNTDRSDTPLTSDLQAMDEEEDTGLSFDGEDVLEDAESSNRIAPNKQTNLDSPLPSADDTCNDIINISMDTYDHPSGLQDDSKSADLPGEDTCDDIKNITMDTFELFPPNGNEEHKASPIGDDTCDDVLNISTDTSSHVNPVLNGNQGTSSVMGATEDTGLDIDDISTDTSNIVLSQAVTNGNREQSVPLNDDHHHNSNISPHLDSNLNEDDQSQGNHVTDDNSERKIASLHLVNGNRGLQPDDCHQVTNGNEDAFNSPPADPNTNGNLFGVGSHLKGTQGKFVGEEKERLDPKRKRYSYNRSIYQSELDGTKNKNQNSKRNDLDGSSQSLPGENSARDTNKVIWIESSFVGARTTTSIVVLPTKDVVKDGCKGSTGSNSSVGRPASR